MPTPFPRGIQTLIIACALSTAAIALSGCGDTSSDASAPAEPAVDPRVASAEALLEYYNSLATADPQNIRAEVELFYAEDNMQSRFIDFVKASIPIAELDDQMFRTFGECLNPKNTRSMLTPDEPAVFVSREDRRAQATYVDDNGDDQTLYLVEVNNRWYMSGYTIEYNPGADGIANITDEFVESMKQSSSIALRIIEQIRNGTLESADAARNAYAAAIVDALPLGPDDPPD